MFIYNFCMTMKIKGRSDLTINVEVFSQSHYSMGDLLCWNLNSI